MAEKLSRWGELLGPFSSLFTLISCIHSCFFSDWRCTVSSKFIGTQIPLISTEEPVLKRHARCVLSRLRCNGHSLLLSSYLSRIGRIENLSYSAFGHPSRDTSHLILPCPAMDSLAIFSFSTTFGAVPVELPSFWDPMVFRHAPIPQKMSGNNNNSKIEVHAHYYVTKRVGKFRRS